MGKLIYVVDDDPDILELVSIFMEKSGFEVKEFSNAEPLFEMIQRRPPDLIILDLMLPDMDGFEICKNLKMDSRLSHIPVIMLTARVDETDRVLGLELGADDYVTKPFSPRELEARVKAVLRRQGNKESGNKIVIDDILEINLQKYEVLLEGKSLDLTPTEFKILSLLASKRGWVFSREQILNHLWGDEKAVLDRTIDVHIKNLRDKLGRFNNLIKNIRGVGYKLE
ncbi:response regulator transcription factor [bacterium]|nr:response regulator transcription factor [bacterium]